jgi:hypothetical protein
MASPLEWSLVVALLVAVSFALILQRRLTTLRRAAGPAGSPGGGGGWGDGPGPGQGKTKVPVTPRRKVTVTVVRNGDDLSVKVDPWLVAIEKEPAPPQPEPQWRLQPTGLPGPLRWQLRSKGNAGWPFSGEDPTPMVSGEAPILPGTVTCKVGEHYQYTILIQHQEGELEIDPDIFIC